MLKHWNNRQEVRFIRNGPTKKFQVGVCIARIFIWWWTNNGQQVVKKTENSWIRRTDLNSKFRENW